MANTKISQLPEWTGTAADLRWFVMNNSGETETYKFSGYTSPFRKANGFNSTISVYYNPNVVPNKLDMILGGTGNTMAATSSYTDGLGNSIVGGANNVMDLNSPAGGQHYGHSIFGGNNNTLRWRANASVNTILGGQGNLMDCYYGGNTIIGGSSNTSQGSANTTIIGGNSCIISGGDRMGIWGGYSHSINGDYDCNIYGGFDNTISAGGFNTIVNAESSTIAAGTNNGIFSSKNSTTDGSSSYSAIVGGRTHTANNQFAFIGGGAQNTCGYLSATIGGFNLNASNISAIFGGQNNTSSASDGGIFGGTGNNASGAYSIIIGGANQTISSSNQNNSIVGGSQNSITNSQLNSGMLGVYNSSISGAGAYNGLLGGSTNGLLNNIGSVILGGSGCLISGNTSPGVDINNAIIASRSSTIPGGLSHVAMIGTLSGRTATASATTYVEKFKAFGKVVEITDGTNTISNELGVLIVGKNNTSSQDKYNLIVGESNNVNGAGAPGSTGNFVLGTGNILGTYAYANLVIGGYNIISQPYNFKLGNNSSINGSSNISFGEQVNIDGNGCAGVGAYNTISTNYSYSFGYNNDITGTGEYNGIWGGKDNVINNKSYVAMVGCSGRTATTSGATFVENLVVFNYAGLNFADDTAAAAGGVVLGQIYHTGGIMKIRVV